MKLSVGCCNKGRGALRGSDLKKKKKEAFYPKMRLLPILSFIATNEKYIFPIIFHGSIFAYCHKISSYLT